MHRTRRIRSAVRRCLIMAVAGVSVVSTLQDVDAQMCQRGGMGGGAGRMGGGGRGGMMAQGQEASGAAGMMQIMQMAMQAQAMQQQAMFAAMPRQSMPELSMAMQQLAAQAAGATQPTRSGRQYSAARRNRFRPSRSASASSLEVASSGSSRQLISGVSRVTASGTPDGQPQLSGPRDFSAGIHGNAAATRRALPEYVVRLMNRSTN
jgi:hypothetical protein